MIRSLSLLALTVSALPALAQDAPELTETTFPATLSGHAVLPALTLIAPPADAPRDALISGKFTGAARNDAPMSVPGDTGASHGHRLTGLSLPFIGQPLQGFSGFSMTRAEDGSFYVLTDNGFGSKANSPDALLFFHRIAPDFATGKVAVKETVFLHDPDRVIPFHITYEGTDQRYLTGADLDPESIQRVGNEIWIGEEFGPYVIRATLDGRILGLAPTMLDGAEIKGPDNPALKIPAQAGQDYQSQRSGGYEGMGLQPGTGLLWALMEKPLSGADGQPEGDFLRLIALDSSTGQWTGESRKFRLGPGAKAIGDMNFIDQTRALIIERDNGEGDPSLKCAGDPAPDCFPDPAVVKRVVLVDFANPDPEGFVRRIGHIDLMDIADPNGVARLPTAAARDLTGKFTFPFFTIEDVMALNDHQIMLANDNNLPFSSGRQLDQAANNEVIVLDVPELLSAQ